MAVGGWSAIFGTVGSELGGLLTHLGPSLLCQLQHVTGHMIPHMGYLAVV